VGQRDDGERARATVFAPSPLVTVTIEKGADDEQPDEIHLHAGGQGFWIARLLGELGVEVVLCGSFGGETGLVARTLIAEEGLAIEGVTTAGSNGAYVHDRRSGERVVVADMVPAPLGRHEVDEFYGATLVEALEADVTVLGGGAGDHQVVPADVYRRLAVDVRANGGRVVADLSGAPLDAVLQGGVHVLKVSHEELRRDGRAKDGDAETLVKAMRSLVDGGAEAVVVTRAEEPALALVDGELMTVTPPRLEAHDARGAGDSLTAGIAAAVARGEGVEAGLCLGAAAGALNVTRRGLATGRREEIERLARHVTVAREKEL
jgi:1-phosphofructokinase